MQLTHSLNAPGFNHDVHEVKTNPVSSLCFQMGQLVPLQLGATKPAAGTLGDGLDLSHVKHYLTVGAVHVAESRWPIA
jgi:hypothetical protein